MLLYYSTIFYENPHPQDPSSRSALAYAYD